MASRFPVITGSGIVAAPGCGVSEVWRAITAGQNGLKPLSLFESPRYGQVLAGEAQRDLLALGAPSRSSRSDKLGWLAAREAIASSGIRFDECGDRAGVVLGTSVGGSFDSEQFLSTLMKRGKFRARPTRFHECISTVDLVAGQFGLYGPCMAIAAACSSSALAIATAGEMILSGEADVILTGGADSMSRMTWGGFHSLLLVDSAGCRPFDAQRAGMTLGEGGAVLVLESEDFARRRGARILARLSGWGVSCDAYHATAPHPQGAGAAAAMQAALKRAGLPASAIDYINAHGTGTRDNDLAESHALKAIFDGKVPRFSSTKRFFGHALAASGAIEAVVCVESLIHQSIPANPGFSIFDPAIGLQPVTETRPASITHVMSNSFGFGGNNAVLIFSLPGSAVQTRLPQRVDVAVSGISVIGPGKLAEMQIGPPLPQGKALVHTCGELEDCSILSPNQRRRLGRLQKMALIAARHCHGPLRDERLAVAIGTGLGLLEDAGTFIENLISKDEREPMPARFPNSVHNAAAAQVAIDLGARSLNSAPTAREITFECALWQGISQITTDEADCALVGAADELDKYLLGIGQRWGVWNTRVIPGEGAVVAGIAPADTVSRPLARIAALRLGRYRLPFDAEREADWIASVSDLAGVNVVMTGAGGLPQLDPLYKSLADALSTRAGRRLEHRTYKYLCGEFHSASAFGFSQAVEIVRRENCGVLLCTLSFAGAKAVCCLRP